MGRHSDSVEKLFFQGDYQQVLAQSLEHPTRKWALRDLGLIIGALSFVGRPEEAETLFQDHLAKMPAETRIQARSFLAMGFTRKSDYARARGYLMANLRELKGEASFQSRFFIHQGLSFYRYFCGKWRLALRDAQCAFDSAARSDFLFGRVLSSDLRGHLLIQMGQVPLGLRILKEAQTLAHRLNNTGVAKAIELARVGYEAQFGLSPGDTIERLQRHAKTAASLQDTYSHSSVLLELARQYLLRGRFAQAAAILDQAGYLIYSHRNRRQEVALCLRYAYLSYLTGDPARGLSFIQSGKRALDPEVDHALKLALLGMESKLARGLGLLDRAGALEFELTAESRVYGGKINQRILARLAGGTSTPNLIGDKLGDALDRSALPRAEAVSAVLESGYHALLLEILPESRGKELLVLDLGEDSLTSIDRAGIEHTSGLTGLLRQLLQDLAVGERSKAQLIRAIWRYPAYHPLKHNPVVYQAITALRKILGTRSEWIQTTEEGYRLKPGVELRFEQHTTASVAKGEPAHDVNESLPVPKKPHLNHRQLQLLKRLRPGEFVSVHDYRKVHKISELTASRDLGDLKRSGLVLRVGQARATRYVLATPKS